MKKIFIFSVVLCLAACSSPLKKGTFVVEGNIKNVPDQKIYLEQISFGGLPAQIVDSAKIIKGKFTVKGVAAEQGLYRLRLQNNPSYIFINDKPEITFNADVNDSTLTTTRFSTPATASLMNFIMNLDSMHTILIGENDNIETLKKQQNDSLLIPAISNFNTADNLYKKFLYQYIDTTASPITAIFALGYSMELGVDSVKQLVDHLQKKFPKESSIADVAQQFNQYVASQNRQQQQETTSPIAVGKMAPDFSLPDVDGKPFKLSSLRGKYVLVDFWASWCSPCREENPNVVAAYKQFKNKNFTVLGVSLDKNKSDWVKAIKDDGLEWKQISDLKYWNNEAATIYGVEAIPFNVLIDPQGKILATSLRGADLFNKLTEVLK